MEGWIKIHRKMINWGWFKDSNTQHTFLYLLLTVAHKDTTYRGVPINKGSTHSSLNIISRATGLSLQSVRTSLDHLKSTGEITITSTKRGSVITISNYDNYQIHEKTNNKESNTQVNTQVTNSQHTYNKNVENIRSKEIGDFEILKKQEKEYYEKQFADFDKILESEEYDPSNLK